VGLRKPTSGRLFLEGIEPYKEREKALRMVSYSFEKPRFELNISVNDVIKTVESSCETRDELVSYLKLLGISEYASRKLYELSSGQAQLLALFISVICYKRTIAV